MHYCAEQTAFCFAEEAKCNKCFGCKQISRLQEADQALHKLLPLVLHQCDKSLSLPAQG